MSIRILIADDEPLQRMDLRDMLTEQGYLVVGEVRDGLSAIKRARQERPDVVIMDIQMPIMDGLTTLPEVKRLYPNIRVIMLSMHNDHSMISRMMEIGANSYLTKDSDSETIYQAIRTCYQQEFFFNDLTNKALLNGLRTKRTVESNTPHDVQLTEKEILILRLMCDEKSTKEIADIVDLSPRTVEAIRDKLKTKTGTKSMAGLVMYAVKAGIVEQPH